MKKFIIYISMALMIIGCGSSSSIEEVHETHSDTQKELKGFYVDDPIVNVSYRCGKYNGQTDDNGTFIFEDGEDCEFFISDILLQIVDASRLKDGITIFENNLTIASFLQSLDSSTDNKILKIDDETIKALKELAIEQIPDEMENLVIELNQKLKSKNITLKSKTKQEALSYLKESYQEYKNQIHILTDNSVSLVDDMTILTEDINVSVDDNGSQTADTNMQNGEDVNDESSDNNMQDSEDDEETVVNVDKTEQNIQALVGEWSGSEDHIKISLELRKDRTYKYHSRLGIGKYHNYYRYSDYEGKWSLQNGNSQIVLELPNVDAPLVLTNKFPKIETPAGVELSSNDIDTSYEMSIDQSQNIIKASYTQSAKKYMSRDTSDFAVDYFTMVAPKANSEAFWSSANVKPMGYNYGHKLGNWTEEWKYALKRIKDDPKNYTMVISDENWQTMIGARWNYTKDILIPTKMYKWFEYFKDQMQILGKVDGTVLYIISGDAPPNWASSIRTKYNNDASTIPAKLIESRFPEVLERNPSNSFAGVFQMMDYLRMKYAPNVKLGYTLKTWGLVTKDIYHEPEEGWDNSKDVQIMSDTINSFGIQFDFLSFNFHPRSSHTTEEYESAAKYFGAISKLLNTRDSTEPKLWIWKLSLWNKEQPKFDFTHIDFLVDQCNAIGMTLGHGNDLKKQNGFKDDVDNGIYVKSWIDEYYNDKNITSIPVHAIQGIINWR